MSDESEKAGSATKRISVGVTTLSGLLAYWLLDTQPKFDGSNAVSLMGLGVVASLVIYYRDKIEFVKAMGAEFKLRAATQEARATIQKIEEIELDQRDIRRSMFQSAIHSLTYNTPKSTGAFGDLRVDRFLELIEGIRRQGAYEELREDIANGAWRLMEDQAHMAREKANIYTEEEANRFSLFKPSKLLERAEQEKKKRELFGINDDTSGAAIDTILREVPKLLEVYEEANKKPQQ